MIYKTSLDKLAKITTAIITLLFAAIIIAQILLFKAAGAKMLTLTCFTLLLIYVGVFLCRPINYRLTNDELIIHRSSGDVKIKRIEIKTVQQLDDASLAWSFRVFGVGGLFGYWGRFTNKKMGSMTWYSTRRNKAILIETIYNKKIIITPDEPAQFILQFNP
jgi:Bacterial PH domain